MRSIEMQDRTGDGHLQLKKIGNGQTGNGHVQTISEQPTTLLLKQFLDDARDLVQAEMRLAKNELREDAKRAQKAGIAIGVGGVVLLVATFVVALALVYLLSLVVPLWAAAAIVGVAMVVAGAVLVKSGLGKLKDVKPKATLATLKEDGRWIKRTLSDIRSTRHEHI
jgi:Flp pilus assembly protein TadB